jgi:hypothetical protein
MWQATKPLDWHNRSRVAYVVGHSWVPQQITIREQDHCPGLAWFQKEPGGLVPNHFQEQAP